VRLHAALSGAEDCCRTNFFFFGWVSIFVRRNRAYSLLRGYLNNLRLEYLCKDHDICANTSYNETHYLPWLDARVLEM
jgi:hypothetical protein